MTPEPLKTSAAWVQGAERGSQFALKLMAWIALRCGRPVARLVLHPITLYFLLFAPQAQRHSARYLQRALGRPATWRDRYRHVHAFASTVLDRVYLARGELRAFDMRLSGQALMSSAVASGRGAVLLGAHMGSFEALHALGAKQPGQRVAMAMYPDNARMIHSVLRAVAPQAQLDIITIGRPSSTLAIRDWLDAGGFVGMLGDRILVNVSNDAVAITSSRHNDSAPLSFLGQSARFATGPLRVAMLLRRPVIFMVGLYLGGGRYDVRFEHLADFSQPPREAAEREALLLATLAAYVAKLEALCNEAPYNWFNFYDFWHEDHAA